LTKGWISSEGCSVVLIAAGCLWDHLCKLTCKSGTKASRTEVFPDSNFGHAILSIPFIPFIPVN